jgi:hypothetical protein
MIRFFARYFLSDPRRVHIAMNLLLESAMVWRGEELKFTMKVYDKDGEHHITRVNNTAWQSQAGADLEMDVKKIPKGDEHKKGDF